MTISGHHVVMKQVRVAQLKARLSEYLRVVRKGEPVTVLDRDTPIAEIVPIRQPHRLRSQKPPADAVPWSQIKLPPPLKMDVDILEILKEVRADRVELDDFLP